MFTDNHRRYLQNLLRHVEQEVQEAVDLLHEGDQNALFPRYRNFPAAERIDALHAHQTRLRATMRRFMDTQHIAYPGDSIIEAARGYEARLLMVRNAAYELRPRYVRGYGVLDSDAEQACRAFAAELGLLLDVMASELRREPLQLAADGGGDVLLNLLVGIVERHRLLEYRSRLETLLAREQGDRVEVALLGRVSSGKSSLINAMLGQSLLPVGAVPVTTVVTRIRYGKTVDVRTVGIDGHVQAIEANELPDYVDESGNPGNRRRLREVDIRVPSVLLEPGIVLADTPGLGSLHAHASAHALDYLPRCDLGIVAIDAAATLTPQDLDLLGALRDGGAEWVVVLTKADTVTPEALLQQRNYVEASVTEAMQTSTHITAISVHPEHKADLDAWLKDTLQPVLEHTEAQAETRRQRRIAELAGRVRVTLQQALAEQPMAAHDDNDNADRNQGSLLATLDDAQRRLHDLVRSLAERGVSVTVEEIITQTPAGATLAAHDLSAHAAILADTVVRDAVAELRAIAAQIGPDTAPHILRGVPTFAASLPESVVVLSGRGPSLLREPGLRRRLHAALNVSVQNDMDVYANSLNNWLDRAVRELRRAALAVPELGAVTTGADHNTLHADLRQLEALLDQAE
ncbi:MAG: dynamin family protein [Rhodanobacter sp.]